MVRLREHTVRETLPGLSSQYYSYPQSNSLIPIFRCVNGEIYENSKFPANPGEARSSILLFNAMCKFPCTKKGSGDLLSSVRQENLLRRKIRSLDDFILTCLCWIDDALPSVMAGKKVRGSGPPPTLSESEVITIELVGRYLGPSQDHDLFESFGRHSRHFFPALLSITRTTFVRQAANL